MIGKLNEQKQECVHVDHNQLDPLPFRIVHQYYTIFKLWCVF